MPEGFKPFVIYRDGEEIVVGRALVEEDTTQLELDLFSNTNVKENT